jgi:hypothetical protein
MGSVKESCDVVRVVVVPNTILSWNETFFPIWE